MRSVILLACFALVGCSSGAGDVTPDDGGGDDAASTTDGAGDDTSSGGDVSDASLDAAGDSVVPKDVAVDAVTDVATDTPKDVAADALGALCTGFSTGPLVPPSTCDKSGGNTSSEKPADSLYSTSWFGCYRKSDGSIFKDPTDNCLFACGMMGFCPGVTDGPTCESDLKWFIADADRFGCGKKVRLTNCLNGKRVIVVALDRGPNCKVEQSYGTPVVDMGHEVMIYLFDGKTYGGSDKKRIVVEAVPDATPLGPET